MAGKLKQIKDYFGFSRTEQNGILVLFVLLMLVILTTIFLPVFFKSQALDTYEFEEFVQLFEERQRAAKDSIDKQKSFRIDEIANATNINPFPFDPNNLPESQWIKLGLSDQQIQVIKNYESKGGKFYKAEDLEKIYSISQEEYQKLKPFINIKTEGPYEVHSEPQLSPFVFDPNSISEEQLIEMGLQNSTISNIINYRNSGGRFEDKEDFKKIYSVTDDLYALLEEYITIAIDTTLIQTAKSEVVNLLLEINTADTLDLQQLKGIGPSFARRIVKYRDLLGGYSNHKQLLEVYGMDSTRYANIIDHIIIENKSIKKIDINKATIKELIKHPYIEFYLAKSIITQREKIGNFSSLKELMDASLIYDELFYKIKPYLTIDES